MSGLEITLSLSIFISINGEVIIRVGGVMEVWFILGVVGYKEHPWLEQMVRRETIAEACATLAPNPVEKINVSSLDHILVDHNHRFLYCYVPKVSGVKFVLYSQVIFSVYYITPF